MGVTVGATVEVVVVPGFVVVEEEEPLPELPPLDESLEIMAHDKKIRNGKLVFGLLDGTGRAVIVNDLRKPELKAALKEAQKEIR